MSKNPQLNYTELKEKDFQYLWHPFTQQQTWFAEDPLIVERAEGFELIDVNGKSYLDGVSSLWCNVHGHSTPELVDVLKQQAEELCHSTLLGLSHVPAIELAEKLVAITPENLTKVFFSDGGTVAVEAALRMAVEWWRKQGEHRTSLASLESGYHGDSLGSVGLGYVAAFHQSLDSLVVPSHKVKPPHAYRFFEGYSEEDSVQKSLEDVERLFATEGHAIAAFVLEPLVQGAAGIWVQPSSFMAGLSALCKEYRILLVADEVATGFGKTGKLFAVEHGPIQPDILTIGKSLSAGYLPISAVLCSEEIFSGFLGAPEEMKTFFFGQTFSGNPLAAKISLKNIEMIEENRLVEDLPAKISSWKGLINEHIAQLPHVDEVRVSGLMTGVELTKKPGGREPYPISELAGARIARAARDRGVIVRPLGNVIVLMPALALDDPNIERLVRVTAESIEAALGE